MKRTKPAQHRRERFVVEYCRDLNAAQAAIRAGYAPGSAKVTASRLLTDANLYGAIRAKLDAAAARAEITIARTLQEIARLAYFDVRKLYNDKNALKQMHELDDDTAAGIAGVETEEIYEGHGKARVYVGDLRKVRLRSKEKALDMCMSILGMHKTVAPNEGGSINLSIVVPDRSQRGSKI